MVSFLATFSTNPSFTESRFVNMISRTAPIISRGEPTIYKPQLDCTCESELTNHSKTRFSYWFASQYIIMVVVLGKFQFNLFLKPLLLRKLWINISLIKCCVFCWKENIIYDMARMAIWRYIFIRGQFLNARLFRLYATKEKSGTIPELPTPGQEILCLQVGRCCIFSSRRLAAICVY